MRGPPASRPALEADGHAGLSWELRGEKEGEYVKLRIFKGTSPRHDGLRSRFPSRAARKSARVIASVVLPVTRTRSSVAVASPRESGVVGPTMTVRERRSLIAWRNFRSVTRAKSPTSAKIAMESAALPLPVPPD